jgi:photosystem II stability/assembly factor-like uncharacterized protein
MLMKRSSAWLRCGAVCLSAWSLGLSGAWAEESAGAYDPATADAELMPLAAKSLVLDVDRVGSRFLAVGERGHVLQSTDGVAWNQIPVPTRSELTALAYAGSRVVAVGHDQVILASLDGGLSWTRQHHDVQAQGPLLDAIFLDEDRTLAIGAYGQYCLRAAEAWDCGYISDHNVSDQREKTAVAAQSPDFEDDAMADTEVGEEDGDPHLNGIVRTGQGTLLIVGEKGNYYRSTDNGESWTRKALPYRGSMFGVVALDDGVLIAYGLRGNAFASLDDGQSWTRMSTNTDQSLFGATALSGGRAVFVGGNGSVLLRRKGSLETVNLSFPEGGMLAAVTAINDQSFAVGGENGLATFQPGK